MSDTTGKKTYEIKIFEIDTTNPKLNGIKKPKDVIQHIVDYHRSRIKDLESIGKPIIPVEIDPITYYSYLNENSDETAYWKEFLPSSITYQQDFRVKTLAYTLFAVIENKIFAIIGGNGAMVIKKFQNHRYGIELFEYLTDLNEDIISVTTRGISGNLTLNSSTFRDGQKLLDTLSFTNIPSNILLVLKEELKNSPFDFIDFSDKRIYLEIASYFKIKHKITFEGLHQLFITLNEIPKLSERTSLTSFIHIKALDRQDEFKKVLFQKIRDDAANRFGPGRGEKPKNLDIDFIHPSKIQEFYQADYYEIKAKNARKGIKIRDRSELYHEGLRFLYQETNNMNQWEFNEFLGGLRVYTCKRKDKFKAMFWQYLTCEISFMGRPVFQIDGNWYFVKDNFKELMNNSCSQAIEVNYLVEDILFKHWNTSLSEGQYNASYKGIVGYTVFDKALGQNIELCDIMYENDHAIFLIHVKDGFDAKIRDLSNQIIISSNRLMNDRNSSSNNFLGEVIENYNRRKENESYQINRIEYLEKFKTEGKNIIFVMAFKPNQKKLDRIRGNVVRVESNIAKFSLIQCVREMNSLSYPLKIKEINRAP